MPRKNKDWDVRPNLNQTPGAQGTLFSGGSKFMSDERFARGYTPERAAAIRSQIQGPGWREDSTGPAKAQRARIADTVARSTVPVEHLNGVQWGHAAPGQALTSSDDAAGLYIPSRREGHRPLIAVKHEYDRDATVIHEIGHHVSHTADPAVQDNYSYETEHGGKEEAFADEYAEKHFRDRKGKQVARPVYGGGQYAGRIERSQEFWDGYRKNRTWTVGSENVRQQDEEFYKVLPEERGMDEPLIHKDLEYDHEDIKKRTASLRLNPDAHPGGLWGVR